MLTEIFLGNILPYSGLLSFIENIELIQGIVLLAGLLLMIVEVFVPGFGIAGGAGIILVIIGIVMTAENAYQAAVMFIILIFIVLLLLFVILRSAKKGRLARTLILNLSSSKDQGYTSTSDMSSMIGKTGISVTPLRPAGTALFEKERIDVVTQGSFIERNKKIVVVSVSGRRIVVEEAEEK